MKISSIATLTLAAYAALTATPAAAADVSFYQAIAADAVPVHISGTTFGFDSSFGCEDGLFIETDRQVSIIDCDDLTCDLLEARTCADLYVEKIIGIVTDDAGNGRILNTSDDYYNYISYRYVDGAHAGDVILTYCLYSTENNYTDDITARYDWIIDRTK